MAKVRNLAQWQKRLVRMALDTAALLVIMILVSIGVIVWEFTRGPINLEILKPQLEARLTQLRNGQPIHLSVLLLEWSQDRHWIALTTRRLVAMDKDGRPAIEAEQAEITFEALPFLRREIIPLDISLKSGRIRLRDPRHANGLALKPDQPDWSEAAKSQLKANTLRDINLSEFRIEFVDAENETLWHLEDMSGTIRLDQHDISMVMQAHVPASDDIDEAGFPDNTAIPKPLTVLGSLDFRSPGFDLKLSVNSEDFSGLHTHIFPESDWRYTGALDLSAKIRTHPAIGLAPIAIRLDGTGGHFSWPEKQVPVHGLDGTLFYDMAGKRILIREFVFDSATLDGKLSGIIGLDPALSPEDADRSALALDLRIERLESADPDWFEHAVVFDSITLNGLLFPKERVLKASNASIGVESFLLSGSGEFRLETLGGRNQLGIKLKTSGEGDTDRKTLLEYWPRFMAPEGREWLRDQMVDGHLVRLSLQMDCPPELLGNTPLPDSALTANFVVENVILRTLPDLPPVAGIFGQGQMRGNSVDFEVEKAAFGEWEIYQGRVDIDQIYPPDKPGRMKARGRGRLREIMRILDESEMNANVQYDLDISRMLGSGDLELELFFPLEELSEEELANLIVPYTVTGRFENVGVPDLTGEFGLENARFRLAGTETTYSLEGKGLFANIPVEFTWAETIIDHPNITSSHLSATGIADENTLNTFGLPAQDMLHGPVRVTLAADGTGPMLHTIAVTYDFTDTALNLPPLRWEKAAGVPAHASSYYALDENGHGTMLLDVAATDLIVSGDAVFDEAGDLLQANIEKIDVAERFDGRGSIARTEDFGYRLKYTGERFDAGFLLETLKSGDWIETPPLQLKMDVGVMGLSGGEKLENANIRLSFSGTEVNSAHASGAISTDKRFVMALAKEETRSVLKINTEDVGSLLRGVLGNNMLEGGTLDTTAILNDEGSSVRISIRDTQLKNAPFLVKILSLASIRGLIDTLGNRGLHFSEIELPLEISKGQIVTPGARASGPSLGLTARGWLVPASGDLAFDGVVVPSFGINSALGALPLIGDLFVSREGEGVFALVYSVRGDMEDTEIRVNPFSAIAPGILRRIFENPATLPPEEVLTEASTDAEKDASTPDETLPSPSAPAVPADPSGAQEERPAPE